MQRHPSPRPPWSCQPCLDLPLNERVCHAKFDCIGSYRDQRHREHTERQTNILLYVLDYIRYSAHYFIIIIVIVDC